MLAIVFASVLVMRRPQDPQPPPTSPAVMAIERDIGELDQKVDKALEVLVDDPNEVTHEQAVAKLRVLQAEQRLLKLRVAMAKAAFAKTQCPGGRVTERCP
jgi:hypothetical protein